MTFMVDGKELKAHKAILTARSPVFAAMFEHDCKEKQESKVEIIDFSFEAFKELLKFVYTGQVQLEQFAGELLEASDKVRIGVMSSSDSRYISYT